MQIITKEWLKDNSANVELINWWESNGRISDPIECAEKMLEKGLLWGCNWLISWQLEKLDNVRYAVYAARQVLHIFEEQYPGDRRPRNAIEGAELHIEHPESVNASHFAVNSAQDAADTAYHHDGAHFVAIASHYAALSATYDSYPERNSYDAARAAARAGGDEIGEKIMVYGINLLKSSANKESD